MIVHSSLNFDESILLQTRVCEFAHKSLKLCDPIYIVSANNRKIHLPYDM
jgi:hypothetical protein